MTLRIGLDTSALDPAFKAHFGRGIGRYVAELSKYFDTHSTNLTKIGKFDYKQFALPQPLDYLLKNFPLGRQTIRQQLLYPFQLAKLKDFDLLHFPAHMDAPVWSSKEYILTVLDLIPLVCREMYERDRNPLRFKFARYLEKCAIQRAKHIIAISECTANDLNRVLGISREKISVVPLGVDQRFFQTSSQERVDAVRTKLNLEQNRPVVLYVGGIDQRKNVLGLIRILEQLRQARIESSQSLPYLIISGRIESDREYPKLLEIINKSPAKADIILAGFVPDDQIGAFFALSDAFLFPSFYEGFGLPPLEAMASGVPVVSSNTSSMPEVLSDAALYFKPDDTQSAVLHLLKILGDKEFARERVEAGKKQAQKFSWEKTGENTVKVYESLIK